VTYLHQDITEKIIHSSYEVARYMGYGLLEKDYAKALKIEFNECGLTYTCEAWTELKYKHVTLSKKRIDFLVNDEVVVELKVAEFISQTYVAQVLGYLRSMDKKLGLIVCFGKTGVMFKRVIR